MKKTKKSLLGAVLTWVVLLALGSIAAGDEFRDIGSGNDYNTENNIYIQRGYPAPGYLLGGRQVYSQWDTKYCCDGANAQPLVFYENPTIPYRQALRVTSSHPSWTQNHPDETPSPPTGWITSFSGTFRMGVRLVIKTESFPVSSNRPTQTLYFTIRHKDDIRPNPDNGKGITVFAYNQGTWTVVGYIGGLNDHLWKTEQIAIQPNQITAYDGRFHIQLGGGYYSNDCPGEVQIDMVKLAGNPGTSEFPGNVGGVWPQMPASRFANIGVTDQWWPGGGPFFPFGVQIGGPYAYTTSSAGPNKPSNDPNDMWQMMTQARMNAYYYHTWGRLSASAWVDNGRPAWAPGSIRSYHIGTLEHLYHSAAHGIRAIPNLFYEINVGMATYYESPNSPAYRSWQDVLDTTHSVMTPYANHQGLLGWCAPDEWENEGITWGRPHDMSHLIAYQMRTDVPERPNGVLAMGYMGDETWLYMEDWDYVIIDVYPYGNWNKGIETMGRRLDNFRKFWGWQKPVLMMGCGMNIDDGQVRSIDGQARAFTQQEIVTQFYQAITHGARGMLYWQGNAAHQLWSAPNWPQSWTEKIWAGYRQVGNELFGIQGIAGALLSPSTTIDINGEKGIISTDQNDLSHIYKQKSDGDGLLIAVRPRNDKSGLVRFNIAGLESGDQIPVLFERRSIIANQGYFTDQFNALDRHVYLIPASKVHDSTPPKSPVGLKVRE